MDVDPITGDDISMPVDKRRLAVWRRYVLYVASGVLYVASGVGFTLHQTVVCGAMTTVRRPMAHMSGAQLCKLTANSLQLRLKYVGLQHPLCECAACGSGQLIQ